MVVISNKDSARDIRNKFNRARKLLNEIRSIGVISVEFEGRHRDILCSGTLVTILEKVSQMRIASNQKLSFRMNEIKLRQPGKLTFMSFDKENFYFEELWTNLRNYENRRENCSRDDRLFIAAKRQIFYFKNAVFIKDVQMDGSGSLN